MKVVMLGRYPIGKISGGVAVHIVNLISNLGKADGQEHEIHMISFGEEHRTLSDGIARVKILKIHKIYYLLPVLPLWKLMLELRRVDPDIIHLQGVHFSPYLISMLLAGKKYKKVTTLHSYPTRELVAHSELRYNTPKYYFMRWMEKMGLNDADLLICVSTSLKAWATGELKNGRSGKAIVQLNGVDLNQFRPVEKSEARRGLGMAEDDYVIFHAKAFVAKNGQKYLVQSLPGILEHIPNAKLYLAGDGPLKPELLKLIEELRIKDNVVLLGDLPNKKVSSYLAASDVVSVPSIYTEGLEEASSIFLVEAMAMEKPCVASDIGGLTETITDGVNGLLVPDKDEAAISSAIVRLYKDPALAGSIAKNARLYVERERNWRAVTDELLGLYKSLIN